MNKVVHFSRKANHLIARLLDVWFQVIKLTLNQK